MTLKELCTIFDLKLIFRKYRGRHIASLEFRSEKAKELDYVEWAIYSSVRKPRPVKGSGDTELDAVKCLVSVLSGKKLILPGGKSKLVRVYQMPERIDP